MPIVIKLQNVSKYFNKGKNNEIRAVQNTSLQLNEGLVMLVGKSGCGKTTLLNVIGGLEKPDCGSITIGDTTITRYNCEQWDKLRNREIGYIFQNYNLIDELTVYQNLELVLKLAGIDPATYQERIEYALSLVGMEKYIMRHPSSLSGGQQQRVGIARAIVKGANIIIADEPTGNLDDTNTVAVMQLLKGLSKHCLVVVVTHEEDLAAYYADRIVRIVDGVVAEDSANTGGGSLSHRSADHVYLGDMHSEQWASEELDVCLYHDDDLPKAKVTIVCQNGRILLHVDGNNKVTLVTPDSSIVLDQNKFEEHNSQFAKELQLDTAKLVGGTGKPKRIFTLRNAIRQTLGKMAQKWGVRRKNPYRLLYITALIFVLMIAAVAPAFVFNRQMSLSTDDHIVAVYANKEDTRKAIQGTDAHIVDKVLMGGMYLNNDSPFYYNVNIENSSSYYTCAIPISWVGGSVKQGEFYLDTFFYERMQNNRSLEGIVRNKDDMIGLYFRIDETSMFSSYFDPVDAIVELQEGEHQPEMTLRLAGFVSRNQPVVYLSEADYNALPTAVYSYRNQPLTLVFADNPSAFVRQSNIKAVVANNQQRKVFLRNALLTKLGSIIIAAIAVVIQIFCLHRMAKSEYLGKIRLYSQYRSIGVGRAAIFGKISMETAIVSACSTLRGWLTASIILWIASRIRILQTLSTVGFTLFYYPIWVALLCAAFLVVLAQAVNLLAPVGLMARTPAYMMSKYDI